MLTFFVIHFYLSVSVEHSIINYYMIQMVDSLQMIELGNVSRVALVQMSSCSMYD